MRRMYQQKVTKALFAKEVKTQLGEILRGKRYNFNFLGYLENADLDTDVEKLFTEITPSGAVYSSE